MVRPTGLLDSEIDIRSLDIQVDDLLSEIRIRIKICYLHSDIDMVKRVEIIRDFSLGVFNVLIGTNLLREGLDIRKISFFSGYFRCV